MIDLPMQAKVFGRLRWPDGSTVSQMSVQRRGSTAWNRTASDGTFEIADVPLGRHHLDVEPPHGHGLPGGTVSIDVPRGGVVDLGDVTLTVTPLAP